MTPFIKQLDRAERQLTKVGTALELVRLNVSADNLDEAYQSAFELAYEAERFTLMARLLPVYTGRPDARANMESVTLNSIPISIGFTAQGWLGLHIPALLPGKEKGNSDFIRLSLYLAFREFFRNRQRPWYHDTVLIFRHRYGRNRPERQARDHDNIEVNTVADIIALFTLADDSAYLCDHFYCSAAGERDETEVYIVPRCEFTRWWLESNAIAGAKFNLF